MKVRRAFLRLRHRSRVLAAALLLGLGVAGLGAWALAPAMPVLWNERQLARQVEVLAASRRMSQMTDTEIRSYIQQLARAEGFHIEFEDVYIDYALSPENGGVPLPLKLGYTLRLEPALFGFVDWPLVALRIYPVGEQKDDER